MAEEKTEGDIKKEVSSVKEPKISGKSPKKKTMKMKVKEKDEKESEFKVKKTTPKKSPTKVKTPNNEEEKKEKHVEKKAPPKKRKMKITTPIEEKEEEKEEVEEEEELEEEKAEEAEESEEEIEIVEEKEEYKVKIKPELVDDMKTSLRTRKSIKRGIPKFRRQEWFRYKRLGTNWRKPKGRHSKTRKHLGYRPNVVSIGYGGPSKVKNLHPSGFKEVMVYNVNDLEKLDPKREAARIGHSVGVRKRIEIGEKAEELGIRVLNWRP